eukprot:1191099-Heterocapsa_arctica.AAC.1
MVAGKDFAMRATGRSDSNAHLRLNNGAGGRHAGFTAAFCLELTWLELEWLEPKWLRIIRYGI